jgi:hypothetical protein
MIGPHNFAVVGPDGALNGPRMTQLMAVQLFKKLRVAVELEYLNV